MALKLDDHDVALIGGGITGARSITPDTDQTPQRAVAIICTVAGNVTLKLADDSTLTVPVDTGLTILPFAVKTVVAASTTATTTYAGLV